MKLIAAAEGGRGEGRRRARYGDILVVALVLFLGSKLMAAAKERTGTTAEEKAPTTKKCDYCLEEIPIDATRWRACTSQLRAPAAAAAE